MRQIVINMICGGVIGYLLPSPAEPGFYLGLVAMAVMITNSMIPSGGI